MHTQWSIESSGRLFYVLLVRHCQTITPTCIKVSDTIQRFLIAHDSELELPIDRIERCPRWGNRCSARVTSARNNLGTNLWTSARNINFGTEFHWNLNFGIMQKNNVCRSKWLVPKLMKFFKICAEVLVPKFVYPLSNTKGRIGKPSYSKIDLINKLVVVIVWRERKRSHWFDQLQCYYIQSLNNFSVGIFTYTLSC